MELRRVTELSVRGKRVLLRVDYNVPLKEGKVEDDTRIRASLPTLRHLLENGAKVILCSHLGRPKGKRVAELSLKPVAERLSQLLKSEVTFVEDCVGEEVEKKVSELREGEVVLLENLRFHPGETKNDPEFSKALARLCEAYVNDAFSVSHRAHASVVGVAKLVEEKAAGLQLLKEVEHLSKVLESPERPFVAVIGGAKIEGKIEVLKNLLARVDKLLVGGAMANTFLKALGVEVGSSFYESERLELAKEVLDLAQARGVKVFLPVDAVVARGEDGEGLRETAVSEISPEEAVYDIGPETVRLFSRALEGAKTVVWNGPLGLFERSPFSKGTVSVARAIAALNALTVAGGGDTLSAIKKAGVTYGFSYLSTGGGAFLEFLEGKELPGIEVLKG